MEKFSSDGLIATRRNLQRYGKTGAKWLYSLFRLLILLSIGFIIIYPLFYMIVTSLQSRYAFLNSTRVWIPTEFAVRENFSAAFDAMEYLASLWSTFQYELISAAIEVATCSIVAYGLSLIHIYRWGQSLQGVLVHRDACDQTGLADADAFCIQRYLGRGAERHGFQRAAQNAAPDRHANYGRRNGQSRKLDGRYRYHDDSAHSCFPHFTEQCGRGHEQCRDQGMIGISDIAKETDKL